MVSGLLSGQDEFIWTQEDRISETCNTDIRKDLATAEMTELQLHAILSHVVTSLLLAFK